MTSSIERRRAGARHLEIQAQWCHGLGSPLYGDLLERAAADCEAGGAVWSIIEGQEGKPAAAAVALRFMGAVHRLVLAGEAPELARYYASVGGRVGARDDVWRAFRSTLEVHGDRLRELSCLPVQTNEVGRSAVLFGGFLEVARRTGLPLRLLEIGASAGLNLRWDHYRYETPAAAWGDQRSPVRFSPVFEGEHPPLDLEIEIAERAGCDPSPIDPRTDDGRTTLRAYLWPDQAARRQRLDGAISIAEHVPVRVERCGAGEWLSRQLAKVTPGAATVVFHSIMIQYVARDEQKHVFDAIREAGAAATPAEPVAWLRFEPKKDGQGSWIHQLDLSLWPAGEERALAISSPHGPPVTWIAGESGTRVPSPSRIGSG